MSQADDPHIVRAPQPPETTLAHLRGIRREMPAMLEQQLTLQKSMTRLLQTVSDFRDEFRKEIAELKSDVAHLEVNNIARHGETLELRRRLENPRDDEFST